MEHKHRPVNLGNGSPRNASSQSLRAWVPRLLQFRPLFRTNNDQPGAFPFFHRLCRGVFPNLWAGSLDAGPESLADPCVDPGARGCPEAPGYPEAHGYPEAPGYRGAHDCPEAPGYPGVLGCPEAPGYRGVHDCPGAPGYRGVHDCPEAPGYRGVHDCPGAPFFP